MRQESMIQDYLTYLKDRKERSANTLHFYQADLGQFVDYLQSQLQSSEPAAQDHAAGGVQVFQKTETELILSVTKEVALLYESHLFRQEYSKSTMNRKMASVRGFYKYLHKRGTISDCPFADIQIQQNPQTGRVFLTDEQIQKIMQAIPADNPLGIRDRAILGLLYNTGMRVSEIIHLNKKNIDLISEMITIRLAGRRSRRLELWGWVAQLLDQYEQVRNWWFRSDRDDVETYFLNRNGGPLSDRSIRRSLAEYGKTAKLSFQVNPQILRHSSAMYYLNQGLDPLQVKQMLGFQSNGSLRAYRQTAETAGNYQQPVHAHIG